MTVESARPGDVKTCVDFVRRTELGRWYPDWLARLPDRLAKGIIAGDSLLVAREEGQRPGAVVGLIWFVKRGNLGDSGFIRLIAVDSQYQGRGIGRVLLGTAESSIRTAGSTGVFLLVSEPNKPAHEFYVNLGYRCVGRLPDYLRPGITELIFYKDIRLAVAANQQAQ